MAIPAHADPRSHKHFIRGYVGDKHGDPGERGYKTAWNALSEAKPTQTMGTHRETRFCVYCGHRAFPIQYKVGSPISGYACVCKDAMDELEWREQYRAMMDRQAKERKDLEKLAPKRNMNVVAKFAENLCNSFVDDIRKDHLSQLGYERMGITFEDPQPTYNR